ncbi:MAG: hypothetical protein KGJ93_03360 [Patescibacteria group bacterium]|nr:hypothetical protein [Patescibacteria group bacterium]
MFKNLSPQTKSFLVLFCVAVIGTYLAVMLSPARRGKLTQMDGQSGYDSVFYNPTKVQTAQAEYRLGTPQLQTIDTSAWQTYSDNKYPLSFKYPANWKILPGKTDSEGFYVVGIDPGPRYYNINIYINSTGYYSLGNLPAVQTTIGGHEALDVSHLLYGVKAGSYYYTFDNGLSTKLIDNFNALVQSAKFN